MQEKRQSALSTIVSSGLTSCREIVSSFLSRIEVFDARINAIISLNPDALALAERLDVALAVGNATGPLFCIPVLLKDNYDTSNMNTTGGNLELAGSQPSVDAPSVVALKRAGAVILGKVNLHELALEGLSVSSLGGQTIKPYDSSRTPGGSSGGSGAAVAASFSVTTGTDTVNSLRSPASANLLFSIRPTRGLISRIGIISISYTQDVIRPIARMVEGVATALTVMANGGFDSTDNATALVPEISRGLDYTVSLTTGNLKGIRFGVLNGFFNRTGGDETTPVNNAMDKIVRKLHSAGAIIIPINETIYNATTIGNLDAQRFEYRESMNSYLSQPSLDGAHP